MLGARLAESLGKDFRPLPALVGTKQMVGVEDVSSGLELVAIPGGTFDMGFSDRDRGELERCIDCESDDVTKWLKIIVDWPSPVHAVTVAPFLLSRAPLRSAEVEAVGGPRTDEISVHSVEGAPWTAGGPPGVYRGCLMEPPRADGEVIDALTACRGRLLKDKPEDEWSVGVPIASSIRV